MINDLLPRYYEAHDKAGHTGRYETVRSIMIDGHEVAWMRYSSTIIYDMMGLGREGQPVESFGLYCECYFTEGVGWQISEKHGVTGLMGKDGCIRKLAAIYLRQQELLEEYLARFTDDGQDYTLYGRIDDVLADMIARDKRDEFIGEGSNGAHFWGGHFYIDTLAKVIGSSQQFIWEEIDRMVREKKITLEGWVVREYRKPRRATWTKDFTDERDGYVVTAYLPNHSSMKQRYKLKLQAPDKSIVATEYVDLNHDPIFGSDAGDEQRAREKASAMLANAVSAT